MIRRSLLAVSVAALSVAMGCAVFKATSRPVGNLQIERTPERVARGEYLTNRVMGCLGCHTVLDPSTHLPVSDKLGAGGRLFGKAMGLPGNIYATNLTPDPETGLGNWTDDEVLRAVREGVSKDGSALFPMMPYPAYHEMGDDDALAVVAYLRTLVPVKNQVPARQLDFPVNLLVNTMPKPLGKPVAAPNGDDLVARGRYVLTMASCTDCHTPRKGPDMDLEKWLAGGDMLEDGHTLRAPNITPDKETGIGNWTDEEIEKSLRFGQRPDGRALSPVMPWMYYSGMNEADMKALIAYLRTVKPISGKAAPPIRP